MATPNFPPLPPSSRVITCPVCTRSTHDENSCHNCGARLKTSVVVPGILIRTPPPPSSTTTTPSSASPSVPTNSSPSASFVAVGNNNDNSSSGSKGSRSSLSYESPLPPRRSSLFRSAPVYPTDEPLSSSSVSSPVAGILLSSPPSSSPPPSKAGGSPSFSSPSVVVPGIRISTLPTSPPAPAAASSSSATSSSFSSTVAASNNDHSNNNKNTYDNGNSNDNGNNSSDNHVNDSRPSTTANFYLQEHDGVSFQRKRRIYPAHIILMSVFCFLLLCILLAFKYSKDNRTSGIIVFIAFMAFAIFVCICNLRLTFPDNSEIRLRACDLVGFKQCEMCCVRRFSVANFLLFSCLSLLIILLIVCGVMSVFIRHGEYIKNNKWYFLMECVFASVLPSIPLAFISWNRGGKSKQLMLEAGLITSKLGGLHVVLEMSGIYARLFDHNTRVSLVLEHHFSNNESMILENIHTQILDPLKEENAVENFLIYPLLVAICLSILSILLTFLKRATCRDVKKKRSQEKLNNYKEIGTRMKSMLILNIFLCFIVSIILGFGLRYDTEAVPDVWGDYLIGVVMCLVACIVVILVVVSLSTRFGGFMRVSPWAFSAEICLVCLLTISPLAYIAFNRGSNHEEIVFQLLVFTGMICGIHVLLELSGMYASIFHARYRKDNVLFLKKKNNGNNSKDENEEEEEEERGQVKKKRKEQTHPNNGEEEEEENEQEEDRDIRLNKNKCSRFFQQITNAHKVLLFVLICLLCGLGAASALPERSTKTLIIVGFVGVIFVVIVICLCDLKMEYIEKTNSNDSNNDFNNNNKRISLSSMKKNDIGFQECHFLCIKHFSLQWLVTTCLVVALGGFLVISGSIAAYVRYGTYIRDQFWAFLVECMMMSILTAIPVALISWNRGGQSKELLVEVFLITGKFGGLHIMLELSGVYEAMFEQKERYSLVSKNWLTKNETDIYNLVTTQIFNVQKENYEINEQIFLVFLASFFTFSAIAVLLAFLRRKCCRDPNKPRSQEKLHAYAALGVRMKAMLVLSVILCGLVMPELILGLRSDAEFEANCQDLSAFWSDFALSAILCALVMSVVVTSVAAVTTRYGGFILMSPWSFVAELGVVVLLSITPMGYVAYNRGQGHLEIGLEMGILCLKFGGIHLLLELSGYYATALGGKYRNDLVCELPKSVRSHVLEDTISIDRQQQRQQRAASSEPELVTDNVSIETI